MSPPIPALGISTPELNRVLDRPLRRRRFPWADRALTPIRRWRPDRLWPRKGWRQSGLIRCRDAPTRSPISRPDHAADRHRRACRSKIGGTLRHPRLAGKPLRLEKNETSRSLAIAPDRRSFALGTDWYLRRFGITAMTIWSLPLPRRCLGCRDQRRRPAGDGGARRRHDRWYRFGRPPLWRCLWPVRENDGYCGRPRDTMTHRRAARI